jgi:hypothetical protein
MPPRAESGGGAKRTEGKGVHMYAAVRRYEGITDPPEAGRLDAGDGVMASLSVYEDQAGADESVRVAHDWVRENAATLIPNPPQVTEGHVVATDTA